MKYKLLVLLALLGITSHVFALESSPTIRYYNYVVYAPSGAQGLPYVRYTSSQPVQYDSPVFNSYGNGSISSTPNWNVGDFTGLNIPANLSSNFEKSYYSGWYGSSAVQAYGSYIGMHIYTYSSVNDPRSLKTINYGIDFSNNWKIKPWSSFGSNAQYCVTNSAAIPNFYTAEGAIGYLISRVSFRDEVTGKNIIFGAVIWDSRPVQQGEWMFYDSDWSGATNSMVANSVYRRGTNYITLINNSSITQAATNWGDDRWYGYCITANNIYNIKNKLEAEGKSLDIEPSRLVVTSTGFEFEMATEINNQIKNGWMSSRLGDFSIFIRYSY